MSLFISSLNSGSNGNCYYIGNENEAILIDAGVSCRETERRMKRSGLLMEKIKAIFISHEHIDHISGLRVLSKKYQLPVYITAITEQFGNLNLEKNLVKRFSASEPVVIGDLTISAFQKEHDAEDPHSFIISSGSVNIGVFTDIGMACDRVIDHFKQCHAAFLEANYDVDMLMNGTYPGHLKKRISGGNGHLSNMEALDLFNRHRPPFMSHLILSHLSHNNNRPEIVGELFKKYAGNTSVTIASRFRESEVFLIDGNFKAIIEKTPPPLKKVKVEQLSLF